MEMATRLNSLKPRCVTDGRAVRKKNSFSHTFSASIYNVSKLWFSFFALSCEKTKVCPKIKQFTRELPYPVFLCWGDVVLLLPSPLCCSLSTPAAVGRRRVASFLPCPARGTVGIQVRFLHARWGVGCCGSFLPPPHLLPECPLARWQQIAASCPPEQQEMASSRGDFSPHLLGRSFCRDIFSVEICSLMLRAPVLLQVDVCKSSV